MHSHQIYTLIAAAGLAAAQSKTTIPVAGSNTPVAADTHGQGSIQGCLKTYADGSKAHGADQSKLTQDFENCVGQCFVKQVQCESGSGANRAQCGDTFESCLGFMPPGNHQIHTTAVAAPSSGNGHTATTTLTGVNGFPSSQAVPVKTYSNQGCLADRDGALKAKDADKTKIEQTFVDCKNKCSTAHDQCASAAGANHAQCGSDYYACLGFQPLVNAQASVVPLVSGPAQPTVSTHPAPAPPAHPKSTQPAAPAAKAQASASSHSAPAPAKTTTAPTPAKTTAPITNAATKAEAVGVGMLAAFAAVLVL